MALRIERHNEQGEDEIFAGNVPSDGHHGYGWKTARLGDIAYDALTGLVMPKHRPVFVQVREVEAAGRAEFYDLELGRSRYAINILSSFVASMAASLPAPDITVVDDN